MKKVFTYILILLFISLELVAEPIKIGVLTDLSGLGAYWGKQTEVGARILEQELNVNGEKVKFVFEDHKLEPKFGVSGVQSLLHLHQVDAVYSEFSVINNPIAPILAKEKKLFMGVSAAISFLDFHPYAFKTYLDYYGGCQMVAREWKAAGYKKIAMLKAEAEFGEICLKAAQEIIPDIKVISYNYGQNVQSEVLLLKQYQAEAVLNVATEGEIMDMLRAARKIDYHPIIASNSDAFAVKQQAFYEEYPGKLIAFAFPEVDPKFVNKVKLIDPNNSLVSLDATALAYLHLGQMYNAIKNCAEGDSTCQAEQIINASPDSIIGFEGFKNRQAVFKLKLKNIN